MHLRAGIFDEASVSVIAARLSGSVLIWTMRRRWWESTSTTKSTRPVSVETVKKSIEVADAR